jgi:WD40 repeat protein
MMMNEGVVDLASCDQQGTIHLWNIARQEIVGSIRCRPAILFALAFSPDRTRLAAASKSKDVFVWDAADTTALLATLSGHTAPVNDVAFSRNGNLLASCSDDRSVRLWDTVSWACFGAIPGYSSAVLGVTFSPDSRLLASCTNDGKNLPQGRISWEPGVDSLSPGRSIEFGRALCCIFARRLYAGSE